MYESDVNRFETLGPPTMTFKGLVYYKIEFWDNNMQKRVDLMYIQNFYLYFLGIFIKIDYIIELYFFEIELKTE